jgi:acetyl esterase/lipase
MQDSMLIVRARILIPILAVGAVLAAGCNWPGITPGGAAPLRYRDALFSAVTVTPNVTYGSAVNLEGQTVTLQMDAYQPTGDTVTGRPAIIFVHGGSFTSGDKSEGDIVTEANTFAEKGYVTFSIDYRLESPGCSGNLSNCLQAMSEAFQDAQTAVRFVRANAATYGVDPTLIAIGGSSAGAITALNVGYSSVQDPASKVRAAVSISGAYLQAPGVGPIEAGDPPALDFHCTTDPLVAYSWSTSTISQAQADGLDAFLESWNETCHVPFVEHESQIITQTTNFLYWEMNLTSAPK